VHDVLSKHADACTLSVIQKSRPSLDVRGIWSAHDTLTAVEVRGVAESRQTNVELQTHGGHYSICERDVDGSVCADICRLLSEAAVHYAQFDPRIRGQRYFFSLLPGGKYFLIHMNESAKASSLASIDPPLVKASTI